MVNGESPFWDRIRQIEDRLTRLEARDLMTAREVDRAIVDSRHEFRDKTLQPLVLKWEAALKELEITMTSRYEKHGDRLRSIEDWRASERMRLGIIAGVGSLIGSAVALGIIGAILKLVLVP